MMMLNGLQNFFKTLPPDTAPAKLSSVDMQATEPVSFGEILKLKEKQLQQEQEVSATCVAVALAALQTAALGTSLPLPSMETSQETVEKDASNFSTEAISRSVTHPMEMSNPSVINLTQPTHPDPSVSTFEAVSDSVGENTSQPMGDKTEQPGSVLQIASTKAEMATPTVPITSTPVQLPDGNFNANTMEMPILTKQDVSTTPLPKLQYVQTNSTEGSVDNFPASTISADPSAVKPSLKMNSGETTPNVNVHGETISPDSQVLHQASKDMEGAVDSTSGNIFESHPQSGQETVSFPDSATETTEKTQAYKFESRSIKSQIDIDTNKSITNAFQNSSARIQLIQKTIDPPNSFFGTSNFIGRASSDPLTFETPVTATSSSSSMPEIKVTVQPTTNSQHGIEFFPTDARDDLPGRKAAMGDQNTVPQSAPKNFDDAPTEAQLAQTVADNVADQEFSTSLNQQASEIPAPAPSVLSTFAEPVTETEKSHGQTEAQLEGQTLGSKLPLRDVPREGDSKIRVASVDIPVREPVPSRPPRNFETLIDVQPALAEIESKSGTPEPSGELNASTQGKTSSGIASPQMDKSAVRSFEPSTQTTRTQNEQASTNETGVNEMESVQVVTPAFDVDPVIQAAFSNGRPDSISGSIGKMSQDAVRPVEVFVKNASEISINQVGLEPTPDDKVRDVATTFEFGIPVSDQKIEIEVETSKIITDSESQINKAAGANREVLHIAGTQDNKSTGFAAVHSVKSESVDYIFSPKLSTNLDAADEQSNEPVRLEQVLTESKNSLEDTTVKRTPGQQDPKIRQTVETPVNSTKSVERVPVDHFEPNAVDAHGVIPQVTTNRTEKTSLRLETEQSSQGMEARITPVLENVSTSVANPVPFEETLPVNAQENGQQAIKGERKMPEPDIRRAMLKDAPSQPVPVMTTIHSSPNLKNAGATEVSGQQTKISQPIRDLSSTDSAGRVEEVSLPSNESDARTGRSEADIDSPMTRARFDAAHAETSVVSEFSDEKLNVRPYSMPTVKTSESPVDSGTLLETPMSQERENGSEIRRSENRVTFDMPVIETKHTVAESFGISSISVEHDDLVETKPEDGIPQAGAGTIEKSESPDNGMIDPQSGIFGKDATVLQIDSRVPVDDDIFQMKEVDNPEANYLDALKAPEISTETKVEKEPSTATVKATGSKHSLTPNQVDLYMDQSAQSETVSISENNGKQNIDDKATDLNVPVVKSKEKADASSTEPMRVPAPEFDQAPVTGNVADDQVTPVSSMAHYVERHQVTGKGKEKVRDEKVSPVESQPKINQALGAEAPIDDPVKEKLGVDNDSNVPAYHLHATVKEVVQQVVRHLNSSPKSGPTSMHLQLNPQELGEIDIRMVSDSHGVHVTFFAEQASTGKLLETQLDQLRVSLVDSGVHLSGLDIGQHNQSGQKGGSFEQGPNFAQDFSHNGPESHADNQKAAHPVRSLGQSSDIDYLV